MAVLYRSVEDFARKQTFEHIKKYHLVPFGVDEDFLH